MYWATFWAIFSQTHLVTLLPGRFLTEISEFKRRRCFDVSGFAENVCDLSTPPQIRKQMQNIMRGRA
jgi:hypothetical protein